MNIKWYYIALNCIDAIEMILSECDWGATNAGPSENVKKMLEIDPSKSTNTGTESV